MRILFILSLGWITLLSRSVGASDDGSDGGDGVPKKLGEVCGNNNGCATGLDCILLGIRKRCFPITCVTTSVLTAFERENFDLASYGQDMMDKAGVEGNSPMFRPFPDRQHLNVLDGNTTDMGKLLTAFKENPPPLQAVADELAKNCPQGLSPRQAIPNPNNDTLAYYGATWGLGAVGAYEGDVLVGQGSADTQQYAVLNNCFGFILGVDAGVAGLIGIAFTNTIQDLLTGCKQTFPVLSVSPFSLQVGFVDCEDPVWLIEMTAGLDAGFSIPLGGFSSCTATQL